MCCRLKHLAVAAAIVGLATQVRAGYFPGSTDFEDNPLTNTVIWSGIDDIADAIVPDATVPSPRPATCTPSSFSGTRANVLSVDNDVDSPIVCDINGGAAMPASTIYADALVKGTPLANDASVPEVGPTDKILVYTRVNATGTDTNLCVLAKPDASSLTNEYVFTDTHIGKDDWHRIIIEAVDDGTYKVYCDGSDASALCGTYYPINSGSSMSSVAFAGTGSVDDLILSTYIPDLSVTTLAWDPATFESISCTTNGFAVEGLTVANGSYELQVPAGVTVELTGDTGFRTVSVNGTTGAAPLELEVAAAGIAKYFPQTTTAGQDGTAEHPFEIEDVDDLEALAAAATAGALAGGELHFIQTANIDMSTADPFEGIGAVGAENATTLTMNAFEGVYDGNNKTISNITFTNRKGSGLFNLVRNATIKDLTVDTVSYEAPFPNQKLGGAMIVGNGVNCTLQHLVTLGSNGLGNPSTYNAAGIANRLEGRGGPVLVIGCTNNAAIYGCYSKLGGICPIAQGDSTTVTFVDCANTGDIVANGTAEQIGISQKTPGVDGVAGILGYAQGGSNFLSFTNCVNTGTITGVSGSKIASIFGYCGSTTGVKIVGGSAQADVLSINTGAANVTGARFATVTNDVATFVADDALAAGNTYKVMAGNATATYEFTAPGSISFNTALATPTYNITASGLAGNVTSTTEAPVTTYSTGYFPRTETAGQDGTAEHPFEIADLDDLQALQAAVAADIGRNLCYTQTADIALTAAWEGIGVKGGKDLAAGNATQKAEYEAGAFTGVYDGGNHTISNFLMENGTDYGALFNSISGATIKNLKMSWSTTKLCANSASGGSDTGATFVGVAKESTLFNLTALEGTNKVVYASKDFGGIVGYLMAGSTVDSCTNELNVASLKGGRKCGGIAIITQNGSGTATIRNCKNSGTIAGGAQDGAIVGYIGTTTAIIGCENTANAPLLTSQSGTVTVSGGTKSVANRTPFVKNGGTVNGLNFAIVDDNVATFVEDNALAAGNTYKVMAADATATYNFTAPGTIAFDTSLQFTPTYTISAVEGLTLTDATSGNVKIYTAAIAAATWIGGASGAWNDASNWSGGFVPTNTTVATFTNNAEVAISATDACSEMVLDDATVTLGRANGVNAPILNFYGDCAVSVASGKTGSLAAGGLALFNQRTDSASLTIECGFEILDDITFRGVNPGNNVSASFTITGKTTISADANVKTIDHGTTKFQGGIEVAKGVTAKITTKPHGKAEIGTGVTLVANDGAGNRTAIWLMQNQSTSKGVTLTGNAKVAVDAAHDGAYYAKNVGTTRFDYVDCTVYEAAPKPTVVIVAEVGATLTGVTNGVPVTPGAVLSIGATGAAQGAEVTLTISNLVNDTVVTTTELPYSYTMQEYDAYVSVAAVQAPQGYNDPQGTAIEDPAVIEWLSDNGFTQADIDALGNNNAALEKFYEAYIVNYDFRVQGAGVALSFTDITVTNDISVTVQLVRTAPLGPIHGKLYIYGATDLTGSYSRIVDTSVSFGETDETFDTTPTQGTVTQTATATLTFVSDKFFKAQIHAEIPENGE